MKLKRIIYITRLTLPKKGPRSIEVLKNCVALAEQNIEVFLYIKKNKFPDMDSLSQYYGFQIPQGLHIKTLPLLFRFSPALIAFFVYLKAIFDRKGMVFYVRDFALAWNIIRLKWLHKIPVFFETHCIPRIYGERTILANRKDMGWDKAKSVEFVHENSDGLICAFKETEEFLLNSHVKVPVVCAWFGTEPVLDFNYDFSSREGIYYIGSFSRTHIPELFLKAMKYVKNEKLFLIGGYNKEEISFVKECIKKYDVSDRVIFKDYVPPAEVSNHLRQAKVVISLWAGLKLTDYFSHGLPIVVSTNTSEGILRDNDNCIFYQPNDPKSLADAINKILINPALAETLARNAYRTAQEYTWQKRAEKIINFIKENM